jgi:hypothetical protein
MCWRDHKINQRPPGDAVLGGCAVHQQMGSARAAAVLLVVAILAAQTCATTILCDGSRLIPDIVSAGCTNVTGDVVIANLPSEGMPHLAALRWIGGALLVTGNPSLLSLSALENVTNVGGRVLISSNPMLLSLNGLSRMSIGGDLMVRYNPSLVNLDGLDGMSIGGDVSITDNPALPGSEGTQLCSSSVAGNYSLVYSSGFDRTTFFYCHYTSFFPTKAHLQAAVDDYADDRTRLQVSLSPSLSPFLALLHLTPSTDMCARAVCTHRHSGGR